MGTNAIDNFPESWPPTPEKVNLAVKTAIQVAQPSRVYIFGSWARNQTSLDSDLDMAVFLEDGRQGEFPE